MDRRFGELSRRVTAGLFCVGAALIAASCGQPSAPVAPCDLDCGERGVCAISQGREVCVCDEGVQGPGCDQCAGGFLNIGGVCAADPCRPNPCQGANQSTCQVTDAGFECLCDAQSQDNDGDGVCQPGCASFEATHPGQACDDSSGVALFEAVRDCTVAIEYRPQGQAIEALYLSGEFNGWSQSEAMQKTPEGAFRSVLELPAGDYGYKLYNPDGQVWMEDPGNPFTKYVNGIRNSRLRVPDCSQPLLRLTQTPTSVDGRITFRIQYVDGAGARGLSPQGVVVTRDGQPVAATLEPSTGVVTVDEVALPRGKHHYRFEASDSAGRAAEPLFVPVWVESERFEWEDAVMYFVFTDRFADGNPGNNAPVPDVDVKANWQGGDFAGLRQKLDAGYFDDLGVNALWISSISQNTGRVGYGLDGRGYSAYHSYWPISTGWSDGNEMEGVSPVDPHFGTLEEFKALVQAAHARGIRVLVDLVANHVHEDSPLWQHHQSDNPAWFHVPPLGCEESNWTQPIECWFANYLPDFEYRNLEVLDRVVEHAVWLVRETGIDGFRLDAVKHMIDDFTTTLRGRLDEALKLTDQRFYMVGETFTGEDGAEQLKHYVGPDKLDGQFDFPLYWQLTSVFLREERDMRSLKEMLDWSEGFYGESAVMSNFLGNHDVCRAVSHANGDIGDLWCNGGKEQGWSSPPSPPSDPAAYDRLKLAWTFLMTSPGIPLIYYGDEYGMPGAGDPDNRRFMQFDGALNDAQRATLGHVKRLTAVRSAHPAMRSGSRETLEMHGDGLLWAYAMKTERDAAIVVLNRSGGSRTATVRADVLGLAEGEAAYDAIADKDVAVVGGALTVEVGARQSAVLVAR